MPTVGGEIYFESSYEQNCLVNAMCLGLAPHERLIRSAAAGPGNVVVLLGALTGRDGIGGASVLASAELGEGDEAKRPSVQIGDPFAEKKLLECCLELLDRGLLVSLQDLGAAGLTSVGVRDGQQGRGRARHRLSPVPLREPDMEPFEIMVSESQERMLCVVEPERVGEVLEVCERWEVLGDADRRGHRRATRCGCCTAATLVAELPVHVLVDDCPLYDLEPAAAIERSVRRAGGRAERQRAAGRGRCSRCSRSPNIASRRPVFEQYDPVVQSRTVRRPERGRRRRAGACRTASAHRGLDRRQRPAGGVRPARAARPRPSTSAPPTSPASAPSRSG